MQQIWWDNFLMGVRYLEIEKIKYERRARIFFFFLFSFARHDSCGYREMERFSEERIIMLERIYMLCVNKIFSLGSWMFY